MMNFAEHATRSSQYPSRPADLCWNGLYWPISQLVAQENLSADATWQVQLNLYSHQGEDQKLIEALHRKEPVTVYVQLVTPYYVMHPNPYKRNVPLIIRNVQQVNYAEQNHCWTYNLILAARLSLLHDIHHEKLWHDTDIKTILTSLAEVAGFASAQLEWQISGDGLAALQLMQPATISCFEFWQWLMSVAGWCYWIELDEKSQQEKLIIADQVNAFPRYNNSRLQEMDAAGLRQFGQEGLFGYEQLTLVTQGQAEEISVRGYHPDQSSRYFESQKISCPLWLNATNAATTQHYYQAMQNATQAETDWLATQYQRYQQQQHLTARLTVAHTGFYPGLCVMVPTAWGNDIPGLPNEMPWLVTEVKLQLKTPDQVAASQDEQAFYLSEVSLIPARHPYQLPLWNMPLLPALQRAHIESQDSFAHLSDSGHYRIRHHYEQQDSALTQESHDIRRITPYLTPDQDTTGLHAPIHQQSEITLAYLNNDPRQPIITSTLNHSDHPNIVTQQNAYQNVLRTKSNQSLMMHDDPASPKILMRNQDGTHSALLDATPGQEQIALHSESEQGLQTQSAGNDLTEYFGGQSNEFTQTNRTETAGQHHITTTQQDHTTLTQGDHSASSQGNMNWTAHQNLNQQIGNTLQQQVQGNANWLTTGKQHVVQVVKGLAEFEVATDLMIVGTGKDMLTIQNNQGQIAIHPDGTVKVQGQFINAQGQTSVDSFGKIYHVPDPLAFPTNEKMLNEQINKDVQLLAVEFDLPEIPQLQNVNLGIVETPLGLGHLTISFNGTLLLAKDGATTAVVVDKDGYRIQAVNELNKIFNSCKIDFDGRMSEASFGSEQFGGFVSPANQESSSSEFTDSSPGFYLFHHDLVNVNKKVDSWNINGTLGFDIRIDLIPKPPTSNQTKVSAQTIDLTVLAATLGGIAISILRVVAVVAVA